MDSSFLRYRFDRLKTYKMKSFQPNLNIFFVLTVVIFMTITSCSEQTDNNSNRIILSKEYNNHLVNYKNLTEKSIAIMMEKMEILKNSSNMPHAISSKKQMEIEEKLMNINIEIKNELYSAIDTLRKICLLDKGSSICGSLKDLEKRYEKIKLSIQKNERTIKILSPK